MYIYYDRVSYKGIEDKKVRLTIDKNLLYRDYDVDAMEGKFGKNLLDPTKVIMEVKVPEERPDWLVALLEKYQIEKQSFS
ncbi:VTC domain-containing protein, partial [Streptococcus suis]